MSSSHLINSTCHLPPRWNTMMKVVRAYTERKHWKERKTNFTVMQEIMLQFAYPRSAAHSALPLISCSAFLLLRFS